MSEQKFQPTQEATKQGGPAATPAENSITELVSLWQRFEALATQTKRWGDNTAKLFWLELDTCIIALKRKLISMVLFTFLMLFFFLSICVLVAVVTFEFTGSAILGCASCVMSLGIALIVIMIYQRHLNQFISLEQTRQQIKEGLNAFTQKQEKDN